MYNVYEEHRSRLPFVRIRKIELTDFKGVRHGTIEFNCAKEYVPYDTKSDILGLYGQNGSGKSSLVEAINTLKGILGGYHLNSDFAKYVDVSADFAKLFIELDFQYRDGTVAKVSYESKIESKEKATRQNSTYEDEERIINVPYISEEIIKTNIYADGSIGRMHSIVDTKTNLFCGDSLEEYFYGRNNVDLREELMYIKRKSYEDSQSFVFSNELTQEINKINTEDKHSRYYEILAEMCWYANNFLYVVGTHSSGLVQVRAGIPVFLPFRNRAILLSERTILSNTAFKHVKKAFEQINVVLSTIIPDLQLSLRETPTVTKDGKDGFLVEVMSHREEKVFPFEYESDGIIKIVSILADYIMAFNQGSVTLVVDEFDSGVFEFLLGELLQIFERSGKGQFIFTSHNLRPLEVIDKKFIRFTTSDSNNRYYKLKNVGTSNNLRDMYLREIQLGEQDVEIYRKTKSFKIVKALKNAGEEDPLNGK